MCSLVYYATMSNFVRFVPGSCASYSYINLSPSPHTHLHPQARVRSETNAADFQEILAATSALRKEQEEEHTLSGTVARRRRHTQRERCRWRQ
jgi:hypothetical protein